MKWGFAVCALMFFTGCSKKGPTPHQAYGEFYEAVMSEGSRLDGLVSSQSLAHLESVLSWVFRGEEEGIEDLSLFDQYMVLSIRMEFADLSRDDWRAWAEAYGKGERGVVDERLKVLWRPFLADRKLGEVAFSRGVMGGRLKFKGHLMEHRVSFADEDGWKIDLVSLWRSDYDQLVKPYLSDNYRNLNPVASMLKGEFGSRYSRGLYDSPLKGAGGE